MDPAFDPDKLYLTKAQLRKVGDKLIAGWTRTQRPGNIKLIWATKAIQLLMKPLSEETCQQYYKDFFKEAFEVMNENAKAGMPELALLKRVAEAKQPEIVSELDFSIKKVLSKRIPHWPGIGADD